MENNNILEVSQIVKYFNNPVKFRVLDGISFQVMQGEFLTLMGKSGSGKSTLLYVLSTMDTDYEGEITLNRTKITGESGQTVIAVTHDNDFAKAADRTIEMADGKTVS